MTEADKELLTDLTAIEKAISHLYFKYYTGEIKINPAINKKAFERYLKRLSAESRKIKSNTIVCLTKQFENEGALPVDEVPFTATPYRIQVIPPSDIKDDW